MLAERDVRVSEAAPPASGMSPVPWVPVAWGMAREIQREPQRPSGEVGQLLPWYFPHQLRKAPILRFALQMLEAGEDRRVAMSPLLVKGEGAFGTRSFHSKPYAASSPWGATGKKEERKLEACVSVYGGQVASFLFQRRTTLGFCLTLTGAQSSKLSGKGPIPLLPSSPSDCSSPNEF